MRKSKLASICLYISLGIILLNVIVLVVFLGTSAKAEAISLLYKILILLSVVTIIASIVAAVRVAVSKKQLKGLGRSVISLVLSVFMLGALFFQYVFTEATISVRDIDDAIVASGEEDSKGTDGTDQNAAEKTEDSDKPVSNSDEAGQTKDSLITSGTGSDVSENEFIKLLSQLYIAMENEEYETAANILVSDEFRDLYWLNHAQGLMPFYFDGTQAYRTIDGTGMVVGLEAQNDNDNSYLNAYFGDLNNGVIEGNGTILSAVGITNAITNVRSVRYKLYTGSWKNGKPNGEGEFTFINSPLSGEEEYVEKKLTAHFVDGLADGSCTQVTKQYGKPDVTYYFTAENGKLVADGKNVTKDEGDDYYIIEGYASAEGEYSVALKEGVSVGISFFSKSQLIDDKDYLFSYFNN